MHGKPMRSIAFSSCRRLLARSARLRVARQTLRVARAKIFARLRTAIFPLLVRHVHGPGRPDVRGDGVILVCLVRNGAHYLGEFLRHYRELGIRHLVFLDNGSGDAIADLLREAKDVTLLRTKAPYRRYRLEMKTYLVHRFGRRNWVLCVDIDEFFDYPGRAGLPLPKLIRYLERYGYNAVVAQMLDLFPRDSLAAAVGEQFRDAHRFYDNRALTSRRYNSFYSTDHLAASGNHDHSDRLQILFGGVRSTGFGIHTILTKHALVKVSTGLRFYDHHHVRRARVADFSAVLLHYKYVGDFVGNFRRLRQERSFWMNSKLVALYLHALEANGAMSLHSAGARELVRVDQLIGERFLVASDRYLDHLG